MSTNGDKMSRCPKCGLQYNQAKPPGNHPYTPDQKLLMLFPCTHVVEIAELREKHRRHKRT